MPPNKYFCPRPFDHVFGEGGRNWKLCCRCNNSKYFEDYLLEEFSPEEWYFSDFMENIRLWMIKGKDPYGILESACKTCHDMEKNGLESDRIFRWNFTKLDSNGGTKFKNLYDSIEKFKKGYSWKDSIRGRFLDLKINIIGNYCNFSCFACQPKNSSVRMNELKKLGMHKEKNFTFRWDGMTKDLNTQNQLDKLLPYTKMIFFQGGEPLLTKDHLNIIQKIINEDVNIQYATNLSRISNDVINTWKKCHNVKLNVSIDGYGKEAEYNRWGLKWDLFVNNMKKVKSSVSEIELCYTTSIVNVMNIGEHYKQFKNDPLFKDYKFNCYSSVVVNPKFLSVYSMPRELREIAYNKIKDIKDLSQVANALKSEVDTSFLFPNALEYIRKLDKSRNVNILDYVPEFKTVY